jgi:hypothetical protein
MTRIALLLLTIGAFMYALWLVLRGKPLPQTNGTRGLKCRFLLATLLFVGLLSQVVGGQSASDPAGSDPNAPSRVVAAEDLWVTIKTVWRTLDPNQAEVFRQHLETAVADGQVRQRVADILSLAFTQIAAQNAPEPQDDQSPPPGGTTTTTKKRSLENYPEFSSEHALWQIQSLRKAQETGGITESLSQGVYLSLAREIEMMWLLGVTPKEWPALDSLWDRYWLLPSRVPPIDSAAVAAKIIVESEGGTVSSLTPLARFQNMWSRVDSLFYAGPVFSDWKSNSISPSIEDILREMDLISLRHYVTCYRSLPRVTERTAELQELQAVLLQKCVDANVIDEQIAAWAADPNGADPNAVGSHGLALPVDFAIEAEMRAYQKKVRCVMVNLYDRGEAPSSFVRDVELAADIEILPVDVNEARRRDMGYFLHALLDCPSREPFATVLEERGLIPPAQNHRMVTYNYNESCEADPNESHVLEFTSLLDSGADVTLKDENRLIWPASLLPTADLDYRITMRRVCRILTKLGYTDGLWLEPVEKAIGIPVVATIREEAKEPTTPTQKK